MIATDIVVVGAGGCGLTAALAAAAQGARVVLLERGAAAGGSTALSAGIFVAAGSRLQLAHGEHGTAADLAANILQQNGHASDPAVTLALSQASGPLMDWLSAQGVPLQHLTGYRYPGMTHAWLVATPGRSGRELTGPLLAAIQRQSTIALHLATAVTGLITSGGTVTGVTAVAANGAELAFEAGAVILAASGFGANAALVADHIPELAGAPYFGTPHATGDAIGWAQALGAAVDHLHAYQTHSSIAYPEQLLVTTYLINQGAIQVNLDGRRFGDETDSYAAHAVAVQNQPGRIAVELFDERILQATLANYARFAECLAAGVVQRAESLSGLAEQFGLNAANLAQTVEQYNQAVVAGRDAHGRVTFGAPLIPPYYGIRVTSALVQTLGGLRVDAHGRVLRQDGAPVQGLYAGGGTAVGLAGNQPQGYTAGTGLLAAFGLGWLAGRHAAQALSGGKR